MNTYKYKTKTIIEGIKYDLKYKITPLYGKQDDWVWLKRRHKDSLKGNTEVANVLMFSCYRRAPSLFLCLINELACLDDIMLVLDYRRYDKPNQDETFHRKTCDILVQQVYLACHCTTQH